MNKYSVEINGKGYDIDIQSVNGEVANVIVNGTPYTVNIKKTDTPKTSVTSSPVRSSHSLNVTERRHSNAAISNKVIKAPLPGVISYIKVKKGDVVALGQEVVILEAMKMENSIEAEVAGVISEIHVEKGDSVLEGDAIITIE